MRTHLQTTQPPAAVNGRSTPYPTTKSTCPTICPCLGLYTDPQTRFAFPSPDNACHRTSSPQTVKLSHQHTHCLTAQHTHCPIFRYNTHLPAPTSPPTHIRLWRITAILVGVAILLGLGGWYYFASTAQPISIANVTPTPTAVTSAVANDSSVSAPPVLAVPTNTLAPTMTTLPSPTTTHVPTATSSPISVTVSATPPTVIAPTAVSTAICTFRQDWQPYTVQAKDTLYALAQNHGISVAAIMQGNCLSHVGIYTGQQLMLPAAVVAPAPTMTADTTVYAAILAPVPAQEVTGSLDIIGTAVFTPTQVSYYKVEIGSGDHPNTWLTIGTTHTQPVQNGMLEQLSAQSLPPGLYTIRLVLVQPDGNFAAPPVTLPITIVSSTSYP